MSINTISSSKASGPPPGDPGLAARLKRHVEGEVLFDAFDRGRYSTDASIYQIEPIGIIGPKTTQDVAAAVPIAADYRASRVPGTLAAEGDGYDSRYLALIQRMRALHRREAAEIAARFPKLLRRVGGYNIDMIDDAGHNMAKLLVGSEGTLAFFNAIELDLQE